VNHDYTGLILTQDKNKPYQYRIELWIGGVKSETNRTFNTSHQALKEVVRIMDGLKLPLESLSINIVDVSVLKTS
jgi:hypothetical protein